MNKLENSNCKKQNHMRMIFYCYFLSFIFHSFTLFFSAIYYVIYFQLYYFLFLYFFFFLPIFFFSLLKFLFIFIIALFYSTTFWSFSLVFLFYFFKPLLAMSFLLQTVFLVHHFHHFFNRHFTLFQCVFILLILSSEFFHLFRQLYFLFIFFCSE